MVAHKSEVLSHYNNTLSQKVHVYFFNNSLKTVDLTTFLVYDI